jgi:predicted molibdopterin-dependent oxidoreductase YjgC
MSWIAEYDTQGREFPTCVHVTKTTGTTIHGATYVPIEDGKSVRAENAKLRELLRAAWKCVHAGLSCSDCRLIAGGCTLQTAMDELGVEVE